MSTPHPAAVAPGWYPDPSVPGVSRWWDGTAWTDRTAPAPLPAVAPVQQIVINNGSGGGPRAISGLSTGMKLVHLVLTVCTLGLWAPVWWLHGRLSRHKVIY